MSHKNASDKNISMINALIYAHNKLLPWALPAGFTSLLALTGAIVSICVSTLNPLILPLTIVASCGYVFLKAIDLIALRISLFGETTAQTHDEAPEGHTEAEVDKSNEVVIDFNAELDADDAEEEVELTAGASNKHSAVSTKSIFAGQNDSLPAAVVAASSGLEA